MRYAFASALIGAAEDFPALYVLDGDCATSTQTSKFAVEHPERFLNAGIAEQNIVGVAAGLALGGHLPVACGFAAMLVFRGAEQIIHSVAYPEIPVVIAGHYAGLSAAKEGAPHHAINDLSFMRSIPNFEIWIPFSDSTVELALRRCLSCEGPTYLRVDRNPVAVDIDGDWSEDHSVFYRAEAAPTTLVCIGGVTSEAVEARADLASMGIRTNLVVVNRLKPFPVEIFSKLVANSEYLVTIEEHSRIGGLASALAEAVGPLRGQELIVIGIEDHFTETGSHSELRTKFGLDSKSIAEKIAEYVLKERS